MPPLGRPLNDSKFSLNSAAVAGFFGGKEAISAMATVHLYRGRRWLGWFNSPGSYTVAKRFGRMANSRFWHGLFPGPNDSPAFSFGLDSKKGLTYIAALSGTTMPTRHLAYLTMERSKEMSAEEIKGRVTKPVDVAYLAMKPVNYDTPVVRLPLVDALLGLVPIVVSAVTCIMCALVYDWFSFSMILLGIISSGWASFVIGKGRLVIKSVKKPADGAPPGHGILMGEDEMLVIKGEERDVNAITKGRFDIETDQKQSDKEKDDKEKGNEEKGNEEKGNEEKGNEEKGNEEKGNEGKGNEEKGNEEKGNEEKSDKENGTKPKNHAIGICSLLLMIQFLLQLLLIPQGSLFGQIMFVVSLFVSWVYNSYLSSLEKEKIQTKILFQTLGNPEMKRFRAGTRTTATVFVCLLLFHGVKRSSLEEDRALRVKVLHSCLSNDTTVWMRWTDKVVQRLLNIDDESNSSRFLEEDEEDRALPEPDRRLLKQLLQDAGAAFKGYLSVRDKLPIDSSYQKVGGQ